MKIIGNGTQFIFSMHRNIKPKMFTLYDQVWIHFKNTYHIKNHLPDHNEHEGQRRVLFE